MCTTPRCSPLREADHPQARGAHVFPASGVDRSRTTAPWQPLLEYLERRFQTTLLPGSEEPEPWQQLVNVLVAVMLWFIWTSHIHAEILSLVLAQLSQLDTKSVQVQTRNLLIQ